MGRKRKTLAVLCLCACTALANAGMTGLGVMGDSLSDDYGLSYARAWVNQLATYRSVNVGTWGSWPYPRYTDFEYNWARQGATSGDLLTQGQHTGLAGQIAAGSVSHAVLFVGHNDFNILSDNGAYESIYNSWWTSEEIDDYVESILSNVQTALDTALAQNASVVLSTFADYAVCPRAQGMFEDPVKRDLVSAVMDQVNNGIRSLAQDRQIVLVDMHLLGDTVFGTNQAPNSTITVGGLTINLSTYGTNPVYAYVEDGIHPQSVIQGIMANLFMEGLNVYDAGLTPFSEAELLAHGGLTGTGSDTLPFQVQDFVYNYTPEPTTLCLLLPAMAFLRSRRATT